MKTREIIFTITEKRIQGKNLHNSKELKRVSEYIRKQYLGEHRHQCEQLEMLIEIFRDGPRSYSSIELIDLINETIIKNGKKVFIDGVEKECNEKQIGKFLYRIGFITLRNNEYNKALGLTRYEDDPYLFSEYNIDGSQQWEIHQAYRTVLKIK